MFQDIPNSLNFKIWVLVIWFWIKTFDVTVTSQPWRLYLRWRIRRLVELVDEDGGILMTHYLWWCWRMRRWWWSLSKLHLKENAILGIELGRTSVILSFDFWHRKSCNENHLVRFLSQVEFKVDADIWSKSLLLHVRDSFKHFNKVISK